MTDGIKSNEILRQVEEIFIIDLLEPTLSLDDKLLEVLVPDPTGLYVKGQLDPLFYDDKRYYLADGTYSNVIECSTVDINNYLASIDPDNKFKNSINIIDANDKLVISLDKLNRLKRNISNQPTYQVTAVNIVSNVILHTLFKICRHSKEPINLFKYIRNGFENVIEEESFQLALEPSLDKLHNFIGKDTFHIYFYKRIGCSLVIEKAVDYRIYAYYKMLEEKQNVD